MSGASAPPSAAISPLRWGGLVIADSYRYLLAPELLRISIPVVPKVDCSNCRKVSEGTASWEIRCCDITPHLPNFLVGEILESGGHPTMEGWFSSRADPFYLLSPPELVRKHLAARTDGSFGLPCQLLLEGQGRCSLYARRPALCIGYHCYYPDILWREGFSCLTSTLDLWQNVASRYLVSSSSLCLQTIASIWKTARHDDDLWEEETQKPWIRKALWQGWEGKEAAFYRDTYLRLRSKLPEDRLLIHHFYSEQLLRRLEDRGLKTAQREKEILGEIPEAPLQSIAPSQAIRDAYQKGFIAAEENLATLREQESFLLWYLDQLQPTGLWKKLTSLLWPRP